MCYTLSPIEVVGSVALGASESAATSALVP
jgi:hypothetical protein